MIGRNFFGATITQRDMKFLGVLAPFIWVLFATATVQAFLKGSVGEGIGHTGMLIVLFCTMIGPHMWGLIDEKDVTFCKVTAIATLFGMLTMFTGWALRLLG
ncbi:MAG: hypothetical protein ABI905_05665 [Betaproteobacteria bacterium]